MEKQKKMNLDSLVKNSLLDSELNALKGGWNETHHDSIGDTEICLLGECRSCTDGCKNGCQQSGR